MMMTLWPGAAQLRGPSDRNLPHRQPTPEPSETAVPGAVAPRESDADFH
jgi:hypothetical protein